MAVATSVEERSVATIRALSADMVQAANSGHPGMPLGMAPAAHVLYSKFLRVSHADPTWPNRDRFVLSNGHGCALLYSMLHLNGYPLSVEDLKAFRQWDSKTPGHPEYRHTVGVEATTGPLGQGISTAVGMAMAQVHQAAVYNRPGFPLFSNYTYVFCGDGCLQEGVSSEACSLAGHHKLGQLIVIYDDNQITIDGKTSLSFSEDVPKRFEAYGWHTITVDNGDTDMAAIERAIHEARSVTDRPSLISLRTKIGFGSKKAGTHGVHGSPLGADDIAQMKTTFGFDPSAHFVVPGDVKSFWGTVAERNRTALAEWKTLVEKYGSAHPAMHAQLTRTLRGELPPDVFAKLPAKPSAASLATRKMSHATLNALAADLPELLSGSADLTPSTLTDLQCSHDFQPNTPEGRYFRYGVREHAMFAIGNGLSLYGGLIPCTSTFLNFITYGFPAVRLAAIGRIRQILIMTHDSIGLGEDGPTHQPVEVCALLRATPNCTLIRPADQNEVNGAYRIAIENASGPTVLALTRQNVPAIIDKTAADKVALGAYVIVDPGQKPLDAVIIASGSEVHVAVSAASLLRETLHIRVVSAPSLDLFNGQPVKYRREVLPVGVPVISVEASSPKGWADYAHKSIGVKEWGASAPAEIIYDKMGLTAPKVAKTVSEFVQATKSPEALPVGALRCHYE